MSRFSKCWPFQQHSVGNGSLLWALSVPLWFCWVCQEYKTITVLNQGDFSGFYLSWGYEGWDNTSLREQEYFYSLQKQEISQAQGSICVSQPSARVSIHIYLPCPQGLWAYAALVQTSLPLLPVESSLSHPGVFCQDLSICSKLAHEFASNIKSQTLHSPEHTDWNTPLFHFSLL